MWRLFGPGTLCILLFLVRETQAVPNYFLCVMQREGKILFVIDDNSTGREFTSPLESESGRYGPIAGDYDASKELVYWVDRGLRSVVAERVGGGNKRRIIGPIGNLRGIAVDWISSHLYFADENLQTIGVSNLDGSYPMALISGGILHPLGIALDPEEGYVSFLNIEGTPNNEYVYWTDYAKKGKVERAHMSGTGRQTIAFEEYPTTLVIDLGGRKLYYCAFNYWQVRVIDLSASSSNVLSGVELARNSAYSFAVFHNTLYFTYINDSSIYQTDIVFRPWKYYYSAPGHPTLNGLLLYNSSRIGGVNHCTVSDNGCEQLCLPEPTKGQCACAYGVIQKDGRSCAESDSYLLLTTTSSVMGIGPHDSHNFLKPMFKPILRQAGAVAIDYDRRKGNIYFTSASRRNIMEVSAFNRSIVRTVVGGVGVAGISVDWTSDFIYYTDSTYDVIAVVHISGTPKLAVLETMLDDPRSIAIDPNNAMMYWTSWGITPKLERAYMSGRGRMTLISSNLAEPGGVLLDFATGKIFWADSALDKIEFCYANGHGRTTLLKINMNNPFGLALNDSTLYFTHSQNFSASLMKIPTTGGIATVVNWFPGITDQINGLVMYSNNANSSLQGSTYCSRNNGGCWSDQLCLPEPLGSRCICLYGVADLTRQKCTVPTSFVMFAEGSTIYSVIPTNTPNYSPAVFSPIDTGGLPTALSCDSRRQRLYWADRANGGIFYTSLLGFEAPRLLLGQLSDVRDVDVDWINGNVYYVDAGSRQIGVVTATGNYTTILISISTGKPVSLALDVERGLMYWTDSGFNARIEVADMSGNLSSRRWLITQGLQNPVSLTIDFVQRKLHWSDAAIKKLEQCNFDGSNRTQTLVVSSDFQWEPRVVAVYNKSLYFTDSHLPGVYYQSSPRANLTIIAETANEPTAVVFYDSNSYSKVTNLCSSNNGGCIHICLPVPHGRVCKCSTGRRRECLPVVALTPRSATVRTSKSLTLQCDVNRKGFGGNKVTWLHDDKVIASETLSDSIGLVSVNYTILNSVYSHSGSYVCRVVNDIGEVQSEVANVTVVSTELGPCWSNPCHLHGSCVDGSAGYSCICREGYAGRLCENERARCNETTCETVTDSKSGSHDGKSSGLFIGVLVLGVILSITVGCICVYFVRRKWKGLVSQHNKYDCPQESSATIQTCRNPAYSDPQVNTISYEDVEDFVRDQTPSTSAHDQQGDGVINVADQSASTSAPLSALEYDNQE